MERDEFSPIRKDNKPPEGSTSYFFIYLCTNYLHMYISLTWATGGSAEQPLQVPGDRALNQSKPHPSGKIV